MAVPSNHKGTSKNHTVCEELKNSASYPGELTKHAAAQPGASVLQFHPYLAGVDHKSPARANLDAHAVSRTLGQLYIVCRSAKLLLSLV
jgi:hypothetical protein